MKKLKKLDIYVLRTNRPGWQCVDPSLDKAYKVKIDAERAGTLRVIEPRTDVSSEAKNFHENREYFKDGQNLEVKDELVLHRVEMEIEDQYGNIVENELGLIELEKVEDVIFIINTLRRAYGDKDVKLMPYSKQLTEAESKQLLGLPQQMLEKNGIAEQRKVPVKNK